MNKYVFILLSSVLLASISQIVLKLSANITYESKMKEYLNKYVVTGYLLLFVSTLLTISALSGMEYKNAPIIETLGYIFVLILSKFVLKEKITKRKIIGNIIIILGVIIFYV